MSAESEKTVSITASVWQSEDFKKGVAFAEMRLLDYLEQAKEKALVMDIPKGADETERMNLALAAAFEYVYDLLRVRFDNRHKEIMEDPFLKMTAYAFNLLQDES